MMSPEARSAGASVLREFGRAGACGAGGDGGGGADGGPGVLIGETHIACLLLLLLLLLLNLSSQGCWACIMDVDGGEWCWRTVPLRL